MADAADSKSAGLNTRVGSTPTFGSFSILYLVLLDAELFAATFTKDWLPVLAGWLLGLFPLGLMTQISPET